MVRKDAQLPTPRVVKIVKPEVRQCSWIVQPGEYSIDVWDGKRCFERNPYHLMRCEFCDKLFCLMYHYHPHIDECAKEKN